MLLKLLIHKLHARLPYCSFRIEKNPLYKLVIDPKHPDVGAVEIREHGAELLLLVGNLSHAHFGSFVSALTPEERADDITEDVLDFLKALLSDKVVLWRSDENRIGGWYRIDTQDSGLQADKGTHQYLWSGPIASSDG